MISNTFSNPRTMMIIPLNTDITIITMINCVVSDNFTRLTIFWMKLILLWRLLSFWSKPRNWKTNIKVRKEENNTTTNHNYIPKRTQVLFHCCYQHYKQWCQCNQCYDENVSLCLIKILPCGPKVKRGSPF